MPVDLWGLLDERIASSAACLQQQNPKAPFGCLPDAPPQCQAKMLHSWIGGDAKLACVDEESAIPSLDDLKNALERTPALKTTCYDAKYGAVSQHCVRDMNILASVHGCHECDTGLAALDQMIEACARGTEDTCASTASQIANNFAQLGGFPLPEGPYDASQHAVRRTQVAPVYSSPPPPAFTQENVPLAPPAPQVSAAGMNSVSMWALLSAAVLAITMLLA